MYNTSEPMSKVMSPEELEAAIAKLQEDDKLRIEKKEKKNPKEEEIKEENFMKKIQDQATLQWARQRKEALEEVNSTKQ